MKSRMRWAGHIARTVKMRKRIPERKKHLEDLGIDGRIMLEWILGK
jgi:hypothetical protein